MVFLGGHLRDFRQKHFMTAQEFADAVGITKGYLDKLESESIKTRKSMGAELLVSICHIYNDFTLYTIWKRLSDIYMEELKNDAIKKIS